MDESADLVISVRGLVKSFGDLRALDGLDLEVRRGEVHGFLGPNGAGKSTTIRSLLGLLGIDGGSATVFGLDPWADAVAIHRRLAYVPGDVALWPNLSGGETIDLLLRMRGADPAGADSRREELLERFQLDPTKRGRAYSKGNRQKVALVAALRLRPSCSSSTSRPRASTRSWSRCSTSASPSTPPPAPRCCSPATSSARSSGWPTG